MDSFHANSSVSAPAAQPLAEADLLVARPGAGDIPAPDPTPLERDQRPPDPAAIGNGSPALSAQIREEIARAVRAELDRRGPADSMAGWLSVRAMVPHMPPGARSESTVRDWIKAGKLRAKKNGGGWAIDPEQAFADLNKQAGGATSVKDFLATWTLKKREEKRTRLRRKFPGAKRRSEE
ncbi:MAG: hypothetical protein Q7S40_09965 [Opitutaceae bacterium]|nr:hypothetical protein [Opitutaceae bacterium]